MSVVKGLKIPGNLKKIGIYVGVSALGDFLFIVPTFRAFKNAFPGAEIVFIGKILHKYVIPVFENCPHIDRIIEFHLYEKKSFAAYAGFVRRMRKEKFDLIVDTQRKFVPSLLLRLAGSDYMVSHSSKGIFSDFPVPVPDRCKRHTSDISLDLARAVGIENPETELEITTGEENKRYAVEFLASKGVTDTDILAGLIPNAGFHTRRWTSEKFGQLADRLHDDSGCRIILFGAESDRPVLEEVAANTTAPVIFEDFSRKSIMDSAALMEKCDIIVGVDSGPLHVADAVGTPCVGIYGPTLPERFGLLGGNCIEICSYADCSPCSDTICAHRKCITEISVDEVNNAAVKLLGIRCR
jgi:ADP-heptose:LPS heptosyltransferase